MIEKIRNIRFILKGIGTYLPYSISVFLPSHQNQFYNRGNIRTKKVDVRVLYSMWLRHIVKINECGISTNFDSIAEIGPGDSLGVGLAALLTGANNYFAIDVAKNISIDENLETLNELVGLFKNKINIPDNLEFPKMKPYLDSYNFPSHILTDKMLDNFLNEKRILEIKNAILNLKNTQNNHKESIGINIEYVLSLEDINISLNNKIDLIFSNAVMEHVADIKKIYYISNNWLKKGGIMSHVIDYKSHGTSFLWNGHWGNSKFVWNLIRGKCHYLINRLPHSYHIKQMKENSFNIICNEVYQNKSTDIIENDDRVYTKIFYDSYDYKKSLKIEDVTPDLKDIVSKDDMRIMSSFVIAQKL